MKIRIVELKKGGKVWYIIQRKIGFWLDFTADGGNSARIFHSEVEAEQFACDNINCITEPLQTRILSTYII